MPRARNKRPISVKIYYSDYDQKWHGYKTVGKTPNGRPDVRHRSAATREECEEKIRQLEDEMAAGTLGKPGRKPTVQDSIHTWLTDIAPYQPSGSRREPLRYGTLRTYWSYCRNWIFPHLGGIRADELTADDLDRLYMQMYEAGLESATVLKVHTIIRRWLAVAQRRGWVRRNVAAETDNPGAPSRRRRKALSREQFGNVLATISQRPDRLRWKIGLAIGPRQGEALAIRWEYVDWDESTIDTAWQIQRRTWRHGCDDPIACAKPHCRTKPCRPRWQHGCEDPQRCRPQAWRCPQRQQGTCGRHKRECPKPCPVRCTEHARRCPERSGGGLVFCRPKTFRTEDDAHVVSIPPSLMKELRGHRKEQAQRRLAAGELWEDYDLVFCQANGRPVDPRRDLDDWYEILRAAGLERGGTHVIRGTAATMALDLGVNLAVVQEMLGHADIRTTRGYTEVSIGLTRLAAKRMDKLFTGNTTDLATERKKRRKRRSR